MQSSLGFGSRSLAAAGAMILIAEAFHPTVLDTVTAGQTAAWLVMMLTGVIALALLLPVARAIASLPPGSNLIDLARAAAGEPGAISTSLVISGTLTFSAGLVIRQTAEMAVSALYPHTPQTVAMVVLVLCALYGAMGGMAGLVTLCRVALPLVVVAVCLIFAGTVGWAELYHVMPFWGTGITSLPLRSVLPSTRFIPVLFILMAAGDIRDRQKLGRALAMALLGAGLVMALTNAMLVMVYPYPLAESITFPLHELSRLVIGGRFFERLDGIWMLVWAFATMVHLAAIFYTAARAFADGFGQSSHRTAVLPVVFVSMTLALFPQDQVQATWWPVNAAPVGLATCFVLPLLLALAALWRRRVKHGAA